MAEYDFSGIPQGTATEELDFKGIPKEDTSLDFSGIPKIAAGPDTTFKTPSEIRAMTPELKKLYPIEVKPSDEAVFDTQIRGLADKIFTHATGIEPEKAIESEKKLENLMSRAPRVAFAFASPIMAAGFEALQQSKNLIVSAVKKEKYSPLEQDMLTKLLPEKTPKPVKIGLGITEWLSEIALMGALADRAKQGLLQSTVKEIGNKLKAKGYGTGKVEISKDAIKEAVKGTTLEQEASRYLKAKQVDIIPKTTNLPGPGVAAQGSKSILEDKIQRLTSMRNMNPGDTKIVKALEEARLEAAQIGEGKSLDLITQKPLGTLPTKISAPIQQEAGNMIQELSESEFQKGGAAWGDEGEFLNYAQGYSSAPGWFKALGRNKEDVTKALQKIIDDAGKDKGKLVEKLKEAILFRKLEGDKGVFDMPIPKSEELIQDLKAAGFKLPQIEELPASEEFLQQQQSDADYQLYQANLEKQSEFEHQHFTDTFGNYLKSELSQSVNLPNDAIIKNIGNFKAKLGQEFIRYYGLTPEARDSFVKLTESAEIREMDIVDFLKKNVRLNDKDAKYLTYHIENPNKYPVADNLKPQTEAIQSIYETIYQELDKRKLLSERFPQTFIDKANDDIKREYEIISELIDPKAIGNHKNNIVELKKKIEVLEQLRYVPHRYKPFMESQVVNLFKEGRVSDKIISKVKKLLGRKIATLDDAKELGLMPEEDIRVLTGSYMNYSLKKIAIYDFVESLKNNPEIVMKESKAPTDWKKIPISQLDGYRVHPYLASALRSYAINPGGSNSLLMKAYDSINRLGKTIVFYNPFVMTLNNLGQNYLAGSLANYNVFKYTWDAIKDFTHRSDFYKDCIKGGLFSAPYNTRPAIEDQIRLAIQEQGKIDPKIKTLLRIVNPATFYNEIQKITWNLDRISRLSTAHYFVKKGLSLRDAIERTNLFMVDYSFIPDQLRVGLNRVFLTPTYRTQMARMYYNFIKHPIKNRDAIGRLVGFHIAVALAAAWAGYKVENHYRYVKKLKKPITTKDDKELSEQVVVGPGPLWEFQKYFGRAAAANLNLNLARVPFIVSSIAKNKDWKGDPIYDNALPLEDRARQQIFYLLKTYFAPVEAFDRLGNEEQSALEKVLNALAIPVYKRQSQLHYFIGQVNRVNSDVRDYFRRHKDPTPEESQEVFNEAQKRMDRVMQKISDYETQKEE